MEGQLLQEFLNNRLRQLGLKRGDVPRLLGYVNANKCLRKLDRLFTGFFDESVFVDRIANSPLGGEEFLRVYVTEVLAQWQALQDEMDAVLLHDEQTFVPHLWLLHEQQVPHPLSPINAYGNDFFKRLELPPTVNSIPDPDERLDEVSRYIGGLLDDVDIQMRINSVYGSATFILYRDEYRHSFVYEVQSKQFIGYANGVPSYPLFFVHKGKKIFRYRR